MPCWMMRSPIWIICGTIWPLQTPAPDRNAPIRSDALDHIVIKKLAELYKDDFICEIQRIAGSLSAREVEALFYFQINGCFAVSKKYSNLENGEWCPVQNMIDRFIKGGISSFPKQTS